jgi:hypothetical protein
MDDTVQIHCSRCKTVFRDRANRLQNGYTRQCPCCEVLLFFDEDSQNREIKRAMMTARNIRKELRAIEAAPAPQRSSAAASRAYSGREVTAREDD